jgi:membrane fusion protein, multidrug efflux system
MTDDKIPTVERRSARRSRRIARHLPLVFLTILVLVIWALFSKIQTQGKILEAEQATQLQKPPERINVVTLELVPSPIRDRINLPGVVAPWIDLNVAAEVKGKIVSLDAKEGERVEKGDTLAAIDPRDYDNRFKSARSAYAAAIANLDRMRELHKEKLSTRAQLEAAEAQMEYAKAERDNAALDLERCMIKAPIAGVVNRLPVEKGQYLNVADTVSQILQIDRVKVKVGIPESDVDAVRNLSRFDVRIDALGGKVFQAKKHFLSRTADPLARLYDLILEVDNKAGEIFPDMFARVEIVKKSLPDTLSIPLYTVISRNNEHIVFVVEEGRVVSRRVSLGLQEEWRVEIREGLREGEEVVVVGHRSVSDGQYVNVVQRFRDPRELVR